MSYNFPPSKSSSIHWEREGEFWENFPCNRSFYRIWLPEGKFNLDSPAVCTSTIVTAFFDIGRESWPFISRKITAYLMKAKVVQSLKNPMVFLSSPEFAERFVAARRSAGLMDRTLVIACDVGCAPQMWLLEDTQELMCNADSIKALWSFSPYLAVPERQEPVYNVLMWMKAGLVRAAATLPHPALSSTKWLTWLDFGCHDPMCDKNALVGRCVDPAPWSRPERVRIAQTSTADDALMRMDPISWTRQHRVLFAGTVFGVPRSSARELMDGFLDTVAWLFTRGVADSDQTVFAWWWARASGPVLDSYPVSGDWHDIVRKYEGEPSRESVLKAVKGLRPTPTPMGAALKKIEDYHNGEEREETLLEQELAYARERLREGHVDGLYRGQPTQKMKK